MNFQGALIGFAAFIIIGVYHPIVVKAEYHVGVKIWPLFLLIGLGSITASFIVRDAFVSAILGLFGFASLWSIRELHEQVERVEKGWFPANPNRS
ncbi:MAG: DUF4491 family protein [Anaerolineales bacterium]|nr:DUF4491 family protein [Anaerolineales bacterium]